MRKFGYAILVLMILIGGFFVSQALWFGGEAVNSAHGVVHQTLDPNHVIFQYDHFHDTCHSVLALNEQIKTAEQTLKDDQADTSPDPLGQRSGIISRDRSNIQALKNSRDSAAQEYNSQSHQINNSIFKSHNLPASIDPPDYVTSCEYVPGN